MIVTGPHIAKWVVDHGECLSPSNGATAIGWERDGKIVAGVLYEEFTEASIHATIIIEHGSVMVKDFLWAIFDYPFNQLGVSKIIVQMSSANAKSSNLAERLGFELEGRIKGAYLDGDRLIYTMSVENCKWLEKNREKSEAS